MNYLQPRQRVSNKRWDYTNMNDGVIYPIGYCREFKELDGYLMPVSEEQKEEHRKFKNKYHSNGHDTYEDACKCYKEYLLDHFIRIRENKDAQHKCKVCNEWTTQAVEVNGFGGGFFEYLCSKHSSREEIEKIFNVGECISS